MAKILDLYKKAFSAAQLQAPHTHTVDDMRKVAVIGLNNLLEENFGPQTQWDMALHNDFIAIYTCVKHGCCPLKVLEDQKIGA